MSESEAVRICVDGGARHNRTAALTTADDGEWEIQICAFCCGVIGRDFYPILGGLPREFRQEYSRGIEAARADWEQDVAPWLPDIIALDPSFVQERF